MATQDKFTQFLTVVVAPLVLVLLATVVLCIMGLPTEAFVVGNFGTLAVLMLAMLYIVIFDSKSRWPGASAFTRFMYVITFKR